MIKPTINQIFDYAKHFYFIFYSHENLLGKYTGLGIYEKISVKKIMLTDDYNVFFYIHLWNF